MIVRTSFDQSLTERAISQAYFEHFLAVQRIGRDVVHQVRVHSKVRVIETAEALGCDIGDADRSRQTSPTQFIPEFGVSTIKRSL